MRILLLFINFSLNISVVVVSGGAVFPWCQFFNTPFELPKWMEWKAHNKWIKDFVRENVIRHKLLLLWLNTEHNVLVFFFALLLLFFSSLFWYKCAFSFFLTFCSYSGIISNTLNVFDVILSIFLLLVRSFVVVVVVVVAFPSTTLYQLYRHVYLLLLVLLFFPHFFPFASRSVPFSPGFSFSYSPRARFEYSFRQHRHSQNPHTKCIEMSTHRDKIHKRKRKIQSLKRDTTMRTVNRGEQSRNGKVSLQTHYIYQSIFVFLCYVL